MNILMEITHLLWDDPLPLPTPSPSQPPGTEGLNSILNWVKWVALSVCIAALIIAGARMAIQARRGEGGAHAGAIGWALIGVIIISGAVALVSALA